MLNKSQKFVVNKKLFFSFTPHPTHRCLHHLHLIIPVGSACEWNPFYPPLVSFLSAVVVLYNEFIIIFLMTQIADNSFRYRV